MITEFLFHVLLQERTSWLKNKIQLPFWKIFSISLKLKFKHFPLLTPGEQLNKYVDFRKVDTVKANLNKVLKLAAESAEKNLNVEKKAVEKLKE